MTFDDLQLSEPLSRAVRAAGYETPTPIQERAIPHGLVGRDLLAIAQTGTGKTAAFALPVLQRLAAPPPGTRPIRALVLAPTRELATQIGETFAALGANTALRALVIFGGVGHEKQRVALRQGVDVLVATPGRLLDFLDQGDVSLRHVSILVLDEADRMLDMGFVHDVKKVIAKVPTERQSMLFSATMPDAVVKLSTSILKDPVRVEVTPAATTVDRIQQRVLFVEKDDKRELLSLLVARPAVKRAIVFTRTKHGANRVAEHLTKAGVRASAIHGNKSQNAREAALGGFKEGTVRVLVATDLAARGIDVDDVSHVINFDLPNVPEQYVHRIGRTARAGASGIALSFCDLEERAYLADIEKLIRQPIEVFDNHPYVSRHPMGTKIPKPAPQAQRPPRGDRRGPPQGGGRSPQGGGRGGGPSGGGGRGGPSRGGGRGGGRGR